MQRTLYIITGFFLLFISCNNKPDKPVLRSSNGPDSISLLLNKANVISNTDSALYWANRAYNLKAGKNDQLWIAKTHLVLSRLYRRKRDYTQGKAHLQKAIAGLEKYGTKDDLGDALIEKVQYFNHNNYTDSNISPQIVIVNQAARLFRQAGDSEKYALALSRMGTLYGVRALESGIRNPDSAQKVIDTLKKALAVFKGGKGSQYAYNALALQYAKDGSWPQAVDYGIHAVNSAEKFSDTSEDVGQLYNNLGLYYYNIQQYSQSYPYLRKALYFDKKNSDTVGLLDVAQALITADYQSKEYDKAIAVLKETEKCCKLSNTDALIPLTGIALVCYTVIGKDELANPYRDRLLNYSAKHDKLDKAQVYVYNYLIKYYLYINQYREAEKYCIRNDSFMHFYKFPRIIASNYSWWAEADSGLGHFTAAFDHIKKAKAINDTLFNVESKKQINELKIKYETVKKEQDIALLTKEARLQQATLRNTKITKNVILGTAATLALMLGLGYNRYRLKQRSNKKLELKQQEINEKNEVLERLVSEKEWLVKEMHHRVKNNLQVVMSLLNTQSMYLENRAAQAAIQESKHRMHTISLIHQKLYQSDNSAMVRMAEYVTELVEYLSESTGEGANIRFEKNIENIELDVSQAMPVGLILNEAITNTIKYAFPSGQPGVINVSMKMIQPDTILLQISDNGIGIPDMNMMSNNRSLGMSLMKGLASQLAGTFVLRNDNGVEIDVEFPNVHLS